MQSPTISIVYQNESFAVDYSKLFNSSNKFREVVKPYLDNGIDPQNLQLRILYDKFATRNVENFLKMIQNQKNNVHSNEIPEICEIAKLFQADALYDKSLTFVRTRIDPNFVSNDFNESNGGKYLEIEYIQDLNTQHSYSTNDIVFNNPTAPMIPASNINTSKSEGNVTPESQTPNSTYYRIQILNPLMKCCRYFFSTQEGRILFTAKKKSNEIYIGHGNNIHIHGNGNECVARIMQCDGYNMIYTNEQEFKVTYIPFGQRKQFSIETSFVHEGKTLFWSPRELDINLCGEYNREPIQSKKNMLLKNQNGAPTFIVRKMQNELFEVECVSTVNPLVAFTIGLSQVVGPYI